mmetsp:Transcript_18201/g.28931  ORF Transcript_18201/g.28931 Transcript_18201/m.28931 type:complete len:88 (-) Transcript_18201:105-368(-)
MWWAITVLGVSCEVCAGSCSRIEHQCLFAEFLFHFWYSDNSLVAGMATPNQLMLSYHVVYALRIDCLPLRPGGLVGSLHAPLASASI